MKIGDTWYEGGPGGGDKLTTWHLAIAVRPTLFVFNSLGRLRHDRDGNAGRELAYTLVTSMTTADRQACERELLDVYRRVLSTAGGPELDRDELWDRYRQGALYAYVAALITAGMGGMQAESIALEGLRRGVAALDDLDTVPLLKKSL